MSLLNVNKVAPQSGTDFTLGDSGDTFTVPSGATLTVAGTLTQTGAQTFDGGVDIDNFNINGTTIALSSGDMTLDASSDIVLDAAGGDIFFKEAGTTFGSARNTSGNLIIKSGTTTALTFSGANVTAAGTIGSGAITSTGIVTGTAFTAGSAVLAEAELELLDGLTAGTAIASKVVTTDGNIDTTGMRNLTISGELDAATLDISGASDLAGVLTVSSGQITFPGTQAASTNANTLDDYEEGTWTPACSGSTVGSANGFYTKIGRVCYISLSFSLTAIGSGNPSQISGLPFTQKNATGHHGIISVGDARNQSTGTVDLRLRTDTNTTLLIFVGKEADDTDYDDDLNVMQNGFSVTASGWYCVE